MREKKEEKRHRARWWIVVAALVLVAGAGVLSLGKGSLRSLVRHTPYRYDGSFHRTIARADRIVVRAGGFDCCGSVKDDSALFSLTDPSAVAEVAAHIQFEPLTITNSFLESCLCCGYPGIDWYRGKKRIALTGMQHGRAIRWKGFTTAHLFGLAIGHGDLPLTTESQRWLKNWFEAHGVPSKETSSTRID